MLKKLYIANTGRKGPVLIDLPKNISTAIFDEAKAEAPEEIYLPDINRIINQTIYKSKAFLHLVLRKSL